MKNHNDEALQNYFNSMLNEKESQQAVTAPAPVKLNIPILPENLVFSEAEALGDSDITPQKSENNWKNIELEDNFQVLFFELSDLMFAVPLADLGGIYHLDDSINSLIGKPDWFSGVMTHNESLFNIVDTAKWINTGQSAQTLNYSHYVLLGSTKWGLSCEKLLGTETLSRSQIKWRTASGKRPWLAGMVKKKMCALIHAEELVKLLNNGMNVHGN
ncbi:MAG: chemotaxis protein CheW [Psychromonas sp.]